MLTKRIVLLALIGALAILVDSAAAEQLVTSLPDGGKIELTLPASWRSTQETAGPAVTIRLSPAASGDFVVLLTIIPIKAGTPASTPEGLRKIITEEADRARPSALQDHIEIVELKGPQAVGYVFHVTDRNPEKGPGDYREANQGGILLGQYLISATILTHPGDTATVEEARRLLTTAKISSGEK